MSVLKEIRSWWIEKHVNNNMPSDVVFEDFQPTVMNGPNREWIKVISLDDFHKKVNINITRYVEVCGILENQRQEITKLKKALEIANDALVKIDSSNDDMKYFNSEIDLILKEAQKQINEILNKRAKNEGGI